MARTRSAILGAAALALAAQAASAQFESHRISLYKWFPLSAFAGAPENGNDCWGYVSPSGREYAIMGLSNCVAFVEVTDPANSRLVAQIAHPNSLWAGIKVYQQYCYVINETGGGMQVIDMGGIDSNVVTLINTVGDHVNTSHTVAVNPETGYLYLAGANRTSGVRIFSLANPANPVWVRTAGNVYTHETTVVSYHSGPYAGREVLFNCNGGAGMDIWDVTNKSAPFMLGATTYPFLQYCHQGWPSEDLRYFYIDDEMDELNNLVPTTRTVIIDIQNLSAPFFAGSFTNGQVAIDHNLYIREGIIYESNYTSGIRLFDYFNQLSPREVGYFDTRPEEHVGDFHGDWSNFPYFPSRTLIVGDIERGLFVLDVREALACVLADFDHDGFVTGDDFGAFVAAFESGDMRADADRDGFITGDDFSTYVIAYEQGC